MLAISYLVLRSDFSHVNAPIDICKYLRIMKAEKLCQEPASYQVSQTQPQPRLTETQQLRDLNGEETAKFLCPDQLKTDLHSVQHAGVSKN